MWECTKSGHAVVDRLLTRLEVGRKERRLRFRGTQFDASGHDIVLDVEDNTTKTTIYIEIAKQRSPGDPVTKGEEQPLRSVAGSLSWIARQARPDSRYLSCNPVSKELPFRP